MNSSIAADGNDDASTNLRGQVALVTGGSRGLGRAFAQALADAGAIVAVSGRSPDELAETVRRIEEKAGRAVALTADVTDREAVGRMVAEAERQLGPIDLLVNNAGVMAPIGPDWEVDPDHWWRTLEINVRGPQLCARAVLPGMIARRNGRIINISSGAANNYIAYGSAYSASKAALTNWTGSLADATKGHNIRVFAYAPGFVRTAMTEYLAESPDVHQWMGDAFQNLFDKGWDTPMERAVAVFLFLASGRADALSGRHIRVEDDPDDLMRRAGEIERDDLYTLRLRV